MLKHTQIKQYKCSECQTSFSRKSRLKMHMMIHKGEQPFECNICSKKFRIKSNYNFHMKNHISKTEKILKSNCDGINNKSKYYTDIFCLKNNSKSIDNNDINNNDNIISNNKCLNNNDDYIKNDKDIFIECNLKTFNNELSNNNSISINFINENGIFGQNNKENDFDNDINTLFKNYETNLKLNNFNKINENIYINEYESFTNFSKENILLYGQKKEIDMIDDLYHHYEQSNFNYIKRYTY